MAGGDAHRSGVRKVPFLLGVAGGVVLVDFLTKLWVVNTFPLHQHVPVLGDLLRITYTHNIGAAFGINIGEHSRVFFLVLSLLALSILGYLYRHTSRTRPLRLTSIALVCGGAVGNILDRLRYERGVVDFIDMGIGGFRWYIFNVADMAVSVGAVLLLVSFYLEDREHVEAPAEREAGGEQPADRG